MKKIVLIKYTFNDEVEGIKIIGEVIHDEEGNLVETMIEVALDEIEDKVEDPFEIRDEIFFRVSCEPENFREIIKETLERR